MRSAFRRKRLLCAARSVPPKMGSGSRPAFNGTPDILLELRMSGNKGYKTDRQRGSGKEDITWQLTRS
jgi:hypothetical protein